MQNQRSGWVSCYEMEIREKTATGSHGMGRGVDTHGTPERRVLPGCFAGTVHLSKLFLTGDTRTFQEKGFLVFSIRQARIAPGTRTIGFSGEIKDKEGGQPPPPEKEAQG